LIDLIMRQNVSLRVIMVSEDILLAIGYNPVLIDKKILITPNEWIIPIQRELPALKKLLEKVRNRTPTDQKSLRRGNNATWYSAMYEIRTELYLSPRVIRMRQRSALHDKV
jgi:hypothetical protein